MSILICGSLAYDTIMVFQDSFKNHILSEKLHMLNVSFLTPEMRREFGGTAGNIAYSLKLLGANPKIMATVGSDFEAYFKWLQQQNIDSSHIRTIADSYTAQAFITTDQDDNQITAFHPGAMSFAHYNSVLDASGTTTIAIIAPDGRDGMLQHARECQENNIPYLFDPGQGLPMFGEEDLRFFIAGAKYLAVNDYEAQLLLKKTGLTLQQLAGQVEALIVTLGAKGSQIYVNGQCLDIPSVKPEAILDPTGCGDAYRAGLLYGISKNWDWSMSGYLASLMGAIKIASRGGQNHTFSMDALRQRFKQAFAIDLPA